MIKLNTIQKRRLENFRKNRRAIWSLRIFSVLFVLSLFAEFIANDQPLLVMYRGEAHFPVFTTYTEDRFGNDIDTIADYKSAELQCLILTGGVEECWYDPEAGIAAASEGAATFGGEDILPGRIVFAPIPYSFNSINYDVASAPSAPDGSHWLGTDDQTRDVLARVIYGFRISVLFALAVTLVSSLIGVALGAIQGYFGGWTDLSVQRIEEIWSATPTLYVLIILGAIFTMGFWLLTILIALFSWTVLTGVVRAEFLRARNFEYVMAARALGVSDGTIMARHILPNALVATVTLMPFVFTGAVTTLTGLDFLGFGLPASYPSLGELALQGKTRLSHPHLGITAFLTFTIMLSLLVFIFEGVRDALDPRKAFR